MIDKNVVKKLVEEWLQDKEYFLVSIEISPDDRIVVEIVIFTSLLTFVFSVILCWFDDSNICLHAMLAFFCVISMKVCAREARKSVENQILEVVIAYKKLGE